MNGQWIGRYKTSNSVEGRIIADIDDDGHRFVGTVRLIADPLPDIGMLVVFATPDNNHTTYDASVTISRISFSAGKALSREDLANMYPNLTFAEHAQAKISWSGNILTFKWTSDDPQLTGEAVIPRSKAAEASQLVSRNMTWRGFKQYVAKLDHRKFIFRGQEDLWRLQTKYHRSGRANLDLFVQNDIPALHRNLSARTKHFFNLKDPDENGAFMHLIQHHGYPTPLLDWTYSPFVAAFFAFNRARIPLKKARTRKKKCRILMFDKEEWIRDYSQVKNLMVFNYHFSITEFIAVENERLPIQLTQVAQPLAERDDFVWPRPA